MRQAVPVAKHEHATVCTQAHLKMLKRPAYCYIGSEEFLLLKSAAYSCHGNVRHFALAMHMIQSRECSCRLVGYLILSAQRSCALSFSPSLSHTRKLSHTWTNVTLMITLLLTHALLFGEPGDLSKTQQPA